jgi:hypothetical protein
MRALPRTLAWTAALVITGCAKLGEAPPPPDGGLVVREDLALRWSRGLPLLPEGSAPEAYGVARGQWRTATTAFSIGAYPEAAAGFLMAAETLRRPDAGPLDDALRAGRCLAYENAASALEGAPDPARGMAKLDAARAADPGCRASITRVLDRLAARTRTATTAARPLAPAAPGP